MAWVIKRGHDIGSGVELYRSLEPRRSNGRPRVNMRPAGLSLAEVVKRFNIEPSDELLGAEMDSFEDRFVNVRGVKTRYWQAGSDGSAVILLHGIGCSVLDWQENVRALASRHRVYALDMLGYGLTEKPSEETYTIPQLAQFTLDFLNTQEIQRAHFAGFSLGGSVVLDCGRAAPERVASMVLLAPAGIAREGMLIHFRLASIPFLGEMIMQPSAARLKTFWDLAFLDQSFVTAEFTANRLKYAMLPGAKEALLKTLRSGLNWRGTRLAHVDAISAALPMMKMPTLVIWGRQDKFISSKHAEVLQHLLPNVQVMLIDQCGHLPQIECSEKFNEAALAFLSDVDMSEGSATPASRTPPTINIAR
jgi:2-hydroxy-6-oxonona-2,4-dienedioate hydrolase